MGLLKIFVALALLAIFAHGQTNPRAHLHIGMFDWDDNLLATPAFIYMEELVNGQWIPKSLTTAEFAAVQQLPNYSTNWRPSTTRDMFTDFTDQAGDDTFLDQVVTATMTNLSAHAGGALPLLKAHLTQGFPISIVTARSHASRNLKTGFKWFISQKSVLSANETQMMLDSFRTFTFPQIFKFNKYYNDYFSDVDNVIDTVAAAASFVAVSNPLYSKLRECGNISTAACKAVALQEIVAHQIGLNDNPEVFTPPTVISFSDDDSNNVNAIIAAMDELIPKYPTACFRVYNTSNVNDVIINNLSPPCAKIQSDIIPAHIKRRNDFQ